MCSAAGSDNVCITVFSSGGSSSYAMIRTELNVATRQTTRVARDMIRPKTRQDSRTSPPGRTAGLLHRTSHMVRFLHTLPLQRDNIWVLNHIKYAYTVHAHNRQLLYRLVQCSLWKTICFSQTVSQFIFPGIVVVKVLCCKPEGRGFETR
jgi:hypothetical protein